MSPASLAVWAVLILGAALGGSYLTARSSLFVYWRKVIDVWLADADDRWRALVDLGPPPDAHAIFARVSGVPFYDDDTNAALDDDGAILVADGAVVTVAPQRWTRVRYWAARAVEIVRVKAGELATCPTCQSWHYAYVAALLSPLGLAEGVVVWLAAGAATSVANRFLDRLFAS